MSADIVIPTAIDTITQLATAATYDQIRDVCIGADPQFICSQLAEHVTIAAASAAWMAVQNQRIARATESAHQALVQKAGVQPVADRATPPGESTSAREQFFAAVDAKQAAGIADRARATALVVAANPDLHQAVIEEANAGRKRRR